VFSKRGEIAGATKGEHRKQGYHEFLLPPMKLKKETLRIEGITRSAKWNVGKEVTH